MDLFLERVKKKSPPNCIRVAGAIDGRNINIYDPTVVFCSPTMMERLELFRGDTIRIYGGNHKSHIYVVLSSESVPDGCFALPTSSRNDLRVKANDTIIVGYDEIKYGKSIQILPCDSDMKGYKGHLFNEFVKPFFDQAYRPVSVGSVFPMQSIGRSIRFKVVNCDDRGVGVIVAPDTVIHCDGATLPESEFNRTKFGFDDISKTLYQHHSLCEVKKDVLLNMKYQQVLKKLGIPPLRILLVHGAEIVEEKLKKMTSQLFEEFADYSIHILGAGAFALSMKAIMEKRRTRRKGVIIVIENIEKLVPKSGKGELEPFKSCLQKYEKNQWDTKIDKYETKNVQKELQELETLEEDKDEELAFGYKFMKEFEECKTDCMKPIFEVGRRDMLELMPKRENMIVICTTTKKDMIDPSFFGLVGKDIRFPSDNEIVGDAKSDLVERMEFVKTMVSEDIGSVVQDSKVSVKTKQKEFDVFKSMM